MYIVNIQAYLAHGGGSRMLETGRGRTHGETPTEGRGHENHTGTKEERPKGAIERGTDKGGEGGYFLSNFYHTPALHRKNVIFSKKSPNVRFLSHLEFYDRGVSSLVPGVPV